MKMHRFILTISALAGVCLCWATAGLAQETQGEEKPKPAAKVYGPIGTEDQDGNQTPDAIQPDNGPLTGIQQPTLGTPMERHSYWVPGVSYYNYVQSDGQTQGGGKNWNSTSYVVGNVSLLENWSRSQLVVNYSGGGNFSTDSALGNGWFQQVGASQTFNWERWQFTLLDQFSYLPQAQFGFGAGTGLAFPGIGGSLGPGATGLGGGLSPGQSIFTAIGPRYTNSFGTQVTYNLTRRSSVTLGGVYSILRFTDAGNIESNGYVGNAGFNYQISRLDTIGVQYRFSSYHYLRLPQAIGDQTIQAVYGRKITGRLALELSGGPEISDFRAPQSSSTKTQYIGGSASASLSYAFANGGASLGYLHGLTSGSGVFLGATSDQITGTASKRISREWTGNAHIGFARNRNAETAPGSSNQSYNTIYVGGGLARPLGRNASVSLGYTGYIETSNNTICAGTNCGTNFVTNQISVGLSWHMRPLVLQ